MGLFPLGTVGKRFYSVVSDDLVPPQDMYIILNDKQGRQVNIRERAFTEGINGELKKSVTANAPVDGIRG